MPRIETKKGLTTLLERMKKLHVAPYRVEPLNYWISVVEGCIKDNLAMDEMDWDNTPTWLRETWRGLK